MKKITFLFAAISCIISVSAQDIDYENVNVEYVRLPLKPVDKSIKNYQVNISLEYLSKIDQQKAAYEQAVKDADADYTKQQSEYNAKVQAAALKHQKDMLAWAVLSPTQQQSTPKPEMPMIPQPVKKEVVEEPYEKVFDAALLANSKIFLQGFNKLQEQPLLISIFLSGFEHTPVAVKQKSTDKKVDNVTTKVITYHYEMTYRHMLKSKILSPINGLIMDEVYNPTMSYATYISKEFASEAELQNWWKLNYKTEFANLQERVVNDNLSMYNDFLNNVYGFKKMNRGFSVTVVDEKSNYDDYKDALAQAKTGYTLIGNNSTFASGVDYIKKAIVIWEKAMTESNPKNKKARIDEDVTEATLYNLSEAYAWINDFPKALENLNKLKTFKLSNKEKQLAGSTASFISDQQQRAIANQ